MFLNLKETMSYILKHISKDKKASHNESENNPNSESKLEEGSTASEEDTFLSIWYPSPPYFPTPYLHNWDFTDPEKALRYIVKHFNLETIHKSMKLFPDLSHNFIYSNTFVDPDCFLLLKHYINKLIHDRNALLQKWLELQARYMISDKINPFIVQCVL